MHIYITYITFLHIYIYIYKYLGVTDTKTLKSSLLMMYFLSFVGGLMVYQVVPRCSFTWLFQHSRKKQRWYLYSIRLLVSSSWPDTSVTPTRNCKGAWPPFGISTTRNCVPLQTFLGPLVTCIRQLVQHQKTYQTLIPIRSKLDSYELFEPYLH